MQVYKVALPEGDVAVVEVQPSKLPPVRFRGRIWIRVGARKAIANEEEERILMERREFNTPNFESEPCFSATLEDLDTDLFRSTLLPAMVDAKEIKKDKDGNILKQEEVTGEDGKKIKVTTHTGPRGGKFYWPDGAPKDNDHKVYVKESIQTLSEFLKESLQN
jgi:predicted HTH transcriptional regulator